MKSIRYHSRRSIEVSISLQAIPTWKSRPDSHRIAPAFFLALLMATWGLLTARFAAAQSLGADSFNPGASAPIYAISSQADGTLDFGFNPGAGVHVYCLAVQADGRILAGGYFTTLAGRPRNRIGRLHPDGTLDATFNPGADAEVYSLAVQEDGKILVAGSFTVLGGQPRSRIGRLNPDGTLDLTFNPGALGNVTSLALQADGKILAGGRFTTLGGGSRDRIGRLNPDGSLDPTFNPRANNSVSSLAVQADGSILAAGLFTSLGGQPRDRIGRLTTTGAIDSTFDPGADERVNTLLLQADGKILVGGRFTMLGRQQANNLGRLHPDGTLDVTFAPGVDAQVLSLALQQDGKILLGGDFTTLGGESRSRIGRLNNTGPATQILTHDGSTITWLRGGTSPEVWRTTFEHSADGFTWNSLGAGTRIPGGWQGTGISLTPEATLRARAYAAGGYFNASAGLFETYVGRPGFVSQPTTRTNDAGTITRFQTVAGGTEPLIYQWFKNAIPLADQENVTGATGPILTLSGVSQADQGAYQVVVSNSFGNVTSLVATLTVRDPFIITPPLGTNRAMGDGVTLSVMAGGTRPLNYQWYRDGLAVTGATGPELILNNLSRSDDGYYTVQVSNAHGSVTTSPVPVTVNGATAPSPIPDNFNPGANGPVSSLAVQVDGKILVGGNFTILGGQPRLNLGRLNPDGTLDATFTPGANSLVDSVVLQPDGKILVGGSFTNLAGQTRHRIGRLNPNGALDPTFNPGANSPILSLALQADGKILVGGYFSTLGGGSRNRIGRLNPDGTLDGSFNPVMLGGWVSSLAVQADGKIVMGGFFWSLGGQRPDSLGRLNPDGTVDATFNPRVGFDDDEVICVAVLADGKILAGGEFSTLDGQPSSNLGRFNPDGTLDSTFNSGANSWVYSLALQADGKVLVGGSFTNLGGYPRNGIGRLNPEGTVDPTFNPEVPRTSTVLALAVQPDGKISVGGSFAALGGQPRSNVGRLYNTSSATQVLEHDGSTVTWLRGGASPEVWRTTFESSTDGLDWTFLGNGTRIPGGWQLAGVSLPLDAIVRARSNIAGSDNGSGWFVQTTRSAASLIQLSLLRNGTTVVLNWSGGQGPYQVQQTSDLSRPDAWQDVGPAVHTNSMSLLLGPGSLFLRVRGQ